MTGIDVKAFEYVMGKIDDGNLFERFASEYLSQILSYNFNPVGGLKDRGIDGLEHRFTRNGFNRYIYQTSIEKNCFNKLEQTIEKLLNNKIEFDRIIFVTNQVFPNKDNAIDVLYEKYQKGVQIYDLPWLSSKINHSEGTIRVFHVFVDSHMHQFSKPGKSYEISNLRLLKKSFRDFQFFHAGFFKIRLLFL
ncbi:MAG: hypothetical protein HZC48_04340 [Nitrospirae bacterium]|nr:hypothetical protein [Nitrospirota bacterium]